MKILLLFAIIFLTACAQVQTAPSFSPADTQPWKESPLTDVITGEEYTISQFEGKVVLLESFAVWCPTCLKQQKHIKEFETGQIVSISLDTDPNENAKQVIDHAKKNGFSWRFSISPIDFTQALIDEFGVTVVNAPSAPIVLICEDQSTSLLPSGLKSPEELTNLIDDRCTT